MVDKNMATRKGWGKGGASRYGPEFGQCRPYTDGLNLSMLIDCRVHSLL